MRKADGVDDRETGTYDDPRALPIISLITKFGGI
jgi:hypothetical protein